MLLMINKKLQRVCITALLFALFVIGVQAQESPAQSVSPEKQALIKELLELTTSKKTVDAMLKAQADQMEKQLPDIIWQAVSGMKELKSLTPQQRESVRLQVVSSSLRSGRRMYTLILEKIDFNKVIEDISIPLYDKYFAENELRDLAAFYKSATGKKVIEAMPGLVAESMTRASEIIKPRISEVLIQIQAEETELATKEIQEAIKTKPTKTPARTPQKRRPH